MTPQILKFDRAWLKRLMINCNFYSYNLPLPLVNFNIIVELLKYWRILPFQIERTEKICTAYLTFWRLINGLTWRHIMDMRIFDVPLSTLHIPDKEEIRNSSLITEMEYVTITHHPCIKFWLKISKKYPNKLLSTNIFLPLSQPRKHHLVKSTLMLRIAKCSENKHKRKQNFNSLLQ